MELFNFGAFVKSKRSVRYSQNFLNVLLKGKLDNIDSYNLNRLMFAAIHFLSYLNTEEEEKNYHERISLLSCP